MDEDNDLLSRCCRVLVLVFWMIHQGLVSLGMTLIKDWFLLQSGLFIRRGNLLCIFFIHFVAVLFTQQKFIIVKVTLFLFLYLA